MSDVTQRDILWTLQEILKAIHTIEKRLVKKTPTAVGVLEQYFTSPGILFGYYSSKGG